MNQILATGNNDEKDVNQSENKYNNYSENNITDGFDFDVSNSYQKNNYSSNRNDKTNIKKIIIIFAICIAVFGIALIAVSVISSGKKKSNKTVVVEKPKIKIEEDGNNVKIAVTSDGELSKITYYWETNDVKEINVTGKQYEASIEIPNGESELVVKAIDTTGQETENTKKFLRDYDEKEPIIKAEAYGTGQIKIIATDETSMDYISYKWGDGEETVVNAEFEGDATIEAIIDVQRGTNKLYITAVDTTGNVAYSTPNFQGALTPTISVKKSGKKIKVTVSHDKGIKSVEMYVNGEITTYDETSEEYDKEKTTVEFSFNMKEGENKVAIVATSLEWDEENEEYTKKTYSGVTTYEPNN